MRRRYFLFAIALLLLEPTAAAPEKQYRAWEVEGAMHGDQARVRVSSN